jgi:hypothetical protein
MTATAQHVPSALTVFLVPFTNSVAPLQSTVCSMPSPVTCVSPFLAYPLGTAAAHAMAIAHAADTRQGIDQFTPVLLSPWRVICWKRAYVAQVSTD